jgi:hypothetical protein
MSRKNEAAALAGARGSEACEYDSAGVDYCPPERKLRQRGRLLAYLLRNGSITERDPRQKCARYHLAAGSPE